MNDDAAQLRADRSCLQQGQYRTDANLAARPGTPAPGQRRREAPP